LGGEEARERWTLRASFIETDFLREIEIFTSILVDLGGTKGSHRVSSALSDENEMQCVS